MMSFARVLPTGRMDIVPADKALVDAELESLSTLAHLLGVEISSSWPPGEHDRNALTFFRNQLEAHGDSHHGWLVWYGVLRGQGRPSVLVGTAGFFGPPNDGLVEVGFSIVPEWRRQGLASEMVAALVDHAFSHGSVQKVVAHSRTDNFASHGVLRRTGFDKTGPGETPETVRFERNAKLPNAHLNAK